MKTVYHLWVFSVAVVALLSCAESPPPTVSAADLALHNRAVGLMGQFQYDAAYREFSRLAERYPDNHDIQVDVAIAILNRQQTGDEETALQLLAQVLEKVPHHLRAHYCSGLLQLHAGRTAEALAHFEEVARNDPTDTYAAYYYAASLSRESRHEEALEWYRQTIEHDPYLGSAYYGAFQTLRKLQRTVEAREMLDTYQKVATNPRVRLAEFKYTRMGPKGEVAVLPSATVQTTTQPQGPLFTAMQSLPVAAEEGVAWRALGPADRAGLTAADINGDGRLDLFATAVLQDAQAPNAVLLATAAGYRLARDHPLARTSGINAALWGDIDNDGLLDVYLCRQGPNQLWRQTERGRWQDITAASATANGAYDTVDGALFDADHDGDLDLFLINADGPNELLNNNRDGTFRPLAAERGIAGTGSGSRSLQLADLDRDRDVDLVVINDRPPHEVYLNDLLWDYRPAPGFDAFRAAPVAAVLAQDRDADGQPELYTLAPDGNPGRWESGDDGQWHVTPLTIGAAATSTSAAGSIPPPALALLDVDGDGASELLRTVPGGWTLYRFEGEQLQPVLETGDAGVQHWLPVQVDSHTGPSVAGLLSAGGLALWSPGPGRRPFIGLRFSGMEDAGQSMRSNASGIGTHAALRTGTRWTRLNTFRAHSGPGQSDQPLVTGLGGAQQVDFLAMEWSDGVFQSELGLEAGMHTITETQRQLSSCPVLFAWNGSTFEFVSDLLGVGGIGYAIGPGEYAEPRPRENLLLPENLLQPRDGRYLLKLTEPMEEAMYLDAVRLVLYELPPGWQMVLDERLAVLGPEPGGEPRFFRNELLPVRALNERAEDVTASIMQADLHAAPPGPLDTRFIGRLAGEHRLTLEFSQPLDTTAGQPLLVIDGWVEYPYSQTMFAAWQAGADYHAPSLDARGTDGRWRPLMAQFGYPAGMPRRMSVPLHGLPAGTTQLRLRTNQEIYWDRIAVAFAEPPVEVKSRQLPLKLAQVDATGFPLRTTGAQRVPHYDYARRAPFWDTRHMAGFYTEFGPAEALVADVDDAVAIIGPGEEIHLEFDAPRDAPAPGWSRTFVLESNGWAKDMDLYTKDGATVAPLPTRGEASHHRSQLHERFNTRYRAGL